MNDPDVRNNSFNQESVSLEDHKKWFYEKLKDPDSKIFIMLDADIPVGQIRFDKNLAENVYVINYSVDAQNRGKGLGERIIQLGIIAHFTENESPCEYLGKVKNKNVASSISFERVGFSLMESGLEYKTYRLAKIRIE